MTLTFEDFLRFLNEVRGKHYYCPYCGNDKFTTFSAAENPAAVMSPLAPDDGSTGFHGVCCTKCGSTAFFADDVVREWLTQHPRVEPDQT